MAKMSAKDVLALILNDETIDLQDAVPRYISGFDQLIAKIDKLSDALLAQQVRAMEYDDDDDDRGEMMGTLTENLTALRQLIEREPEMPDDSETHTLLTTIAKNTMRRAGQWEFDVQRNSRTGFIEKIVATPLAK